jgi:acetyltransferase-like isoleucine patch superfamily enzyme
MQHEILKKIIRQPLRLFSVFFGWIAGLIYVDDAKCALPLVYETPGLGIRFRKKKGGKVVINGRIVVERHGARAPYKDVTIEVYDGSTLTVNGTVILGAGVHILAGKNATVILGDKPDGVVTISYDTEIIANQYVEIKSGCLFSWDILVMDTNYHTIVGTENNKPVIFQPRVWVGARATILKGVELGAGSIVAAGAVVAQNVPERGVVAGNPAVVVKHNVDWME